MLSHHPYQTKAHKLPLEPHCPQDRYSGTAAWYHPGEKDRYAQELFLIVVKDSILSLQLYFLYHFFTFSCPTVSSGFKKSNHPTPRVQSRLFHANQPYLCLKTVASGQPRTLIWSVTMLRSCIYTTAIYLELQPQYRVTRSIYSTLKLLCLLPDIPVLLTSPQTLRGKLLPRHKEPVLRKSLRRRLL